MGNRGGSEKKSQLLPKKYLLWHEKSAEVKNDRKEDWDEKDQRNSLNRGQWTSALAAIPAALQLFNNHADWMIKGLKWLSRHDLILFEV